MLSVNIFTRAYAEEITISGNGAGSNNEVHVESTQNESVSQTNDANVGNDILNTATTGGNTTNNNNSDTTIQTGDANSSIATNNNINSNVSQNNPCCMNSASTYNIENNGTGSQNTIQSNTSTNISSSLENNATVKNNITIRANTGDNAADQNNGNVMIKTGDIKSSIIVNSNTNHNTQIISAPTHTVSVLSQGNADNSTNNIFLNATNNIISKSTNNSTILNNIFSDLNTGRNSANNNAGNVFIGTGSILSLINIANNTNTNFIHADCDCEAPTTPIPPEPSPTPKLCTENCGSSNPSNGSVGGASASSNGGGGEVLPATGSYLIYFITFASLITFLSGWYLRFQIGKSK